MINIPQRLVATAARVPDQIFLVAAYDPALAALSYAQCLQRAGAFAAHLRARGLQDGERVVLHCPNSLDYVCAYFGIWLAGGTVIPLDPRSRAAHVARVVADCSARLVVVPAARAGLGSGIAQFPLSEVDWSARDAAGALPPPGNPLALIIYTSGTTGEPRGVCLSHANLAHTCDAIIEWAQVAAGDRELTTLPLTHLFGLAHLHVYCTLGATLYIEEGFRDVPRLLDLVERERITSFPSTPAGLKILVERFSDAFASKASGLRYMVINTAPMPVNLTQRLLALLPETEVYMYYGLTEASRSTYIAYRRHPDKLASVGRATPGAAVRITQPAQPTLDGAGEILVRGPHVTAGYWGRDSTEYFDAGWFRTGDLGTMDDDGFVTWVGRVREQINVNGLKLVPAEVEAVLRQDAAVIDCAVVGVPDAAAGEAVLAFVVAAGTSVEAGLEMRLRKLCAQQLDEYKVPRHVHVVAEIPKTDSGKIRRLLLRERWIAGER